MKTQYTVREVAELVSINIIERNFILTRETILISLKELGFSPTKKTIPHIIKVVNRISRSLS